MRSSSSGSLTAEDFSSSSNGGDLDTPKKEDSVPEMSLGESRLSEADGSQSSGELVEANEAESGHLKSE